MSFFIENHRVIEGVNPDAAADTRPIVEPLGVACGTGAKICRHFQHLKILRAEKPAWLEW